MEVNAARRAARISEGKRNWSRSELANSVSSMKLLAIFILAQSLVCGASEKPNIVVIMADDFGWWDLHWYGNAQVDTPGARPVGCGRNPFHEWLSVRQLSLQQCKE
jgi:hypothetical protein